MSATSSTKTTTKKYPNITRNPHKKSAWNDRTPHIHWHSVCMPYDSSLTYTKQTTNAVSVYWYNSKANVAKTHVNTQLKCGHRLYQQTEVLACTPAQFIGIPDTRSNGDKKSTAYENETQFLIFHMSLRQSTILTLI